MPCLAFYTFGILREPSGHPQTQGFIDRVPGVGASARGTEGFVTRVQERPAGLGPRFYHPDEHPGAPQTLSVWTDLESVYAFSYHGQHAEALRSRKEWFLTPEWPTYVAWWVDDAHVPTWQEALERLECLYDRGPTPFAFNFKTPYGADGQPIQLDRQRADRKGRMVQ